MNFFPVRVAGLTVVVASNIFIQTLEKAATMGR